MTTQAGIFEVELAGSGVTRAGESQAEAIGFPSSPWNEGVFAHEQIAGLVRQIFSPGKKHSVRQVVFSAVDTGPESDALALDVAAALARQVQASVCVVEGKGGEAGYAPRGIPGFAHESWCFGQLRNLCRPVAENLWLLPHDCFWSERTDDNALRSRLGELRLEFDFTLVSGPPAGINGQAGVLGSAADGVVLLLEANVTRRASAQKARELIQNSNARLLGVVLTDRTFPIPEALYRRL